MDLRLSLTDEIGQEFITNLEILLRDYIVEFIKYDPNDLLLFTVDYFESVLRNRTWENFTKNVKETRSSYASSVYDKLNRRSGISEEKLDIENFVTHEEDEFVKKPDFVVNELREAAKKVSIFKGLDELEVDKIINAMFEMVTKKGEIIIEQGHYGDNFYIISKGIFETYVTVNKEPISLRSYHGEGFFGEIALMYNRPRSATVISRTEGVLWALDRNKFKEIILVKAYKQREKYQHVLSKVELFENMTEYEIGTIADTITTRRYKSKECIIQQGEMATDMFIIESGVVVVMRNENGVEKELTRLGEGEYFGELSMVTMKPRQASVYSLNEVEVMVIESASFQRLLGPCIEIIQRNMAKYEEVLNRVFRQSL